VSFGKKKKVNFGQKRILEAAELFHSRGGTLFERGHVEKKIKEEGRGHAS